MLVESAAAPSRHHFDAVLHERRSVRGFLAREVQRAQIEEVLRLAQQAPSNCNVQPWVVHVVSGESGRALRTKLVEAAHFPERMNPDLPPTDKYRDVYRERQFDAAHQLYGAMGVARNDRQARFDAYLRNFEFFGAPHAAFIFMPKPFGTFQAMDCGMYAQSLMLALTSRGIASCAQGALILYPDIVREHLQVDAEQQLLLGISFGYEDPHVKANAARVGRAEIDSAVRFHG